MPTESDHRLDELLRAYAAKRREDAGEPLELHPATRRLLQGEVARRRPKVSRSQWLGVFSGPWLWPRVSLVGSSLVLAGALAWIWVQSLPTQDEERIALHKSTPPPAAPTAAEPATPRGAFDADSVSRERTLTGKARAAASAQAPPIAGYFQGSTDQPIPSKPDLGTNPEAAPRLTPTSRPVAPERRARADLSRNQTAEVASTFNAPAEIASTKRTQDDALELAASAARRASHPEEYGRTPQAARPVAGSAPRFNATVSAWRTAMPLAATSRFRYQRIDGAAPAQNDRAAGGSRAGGAQPGLLASFELEQWEQRVRILDADGSVYEGSLVNGELPTEKAGARPLPEQAGRAEARPEAADAQWLAPSEADRGTVTFRVSGTNRSLDQLVVIHGLLGSPAAELGLSFGVKPASPRAAGATPTSSPAPVVTAAPLLLKSAGRSSAQIAPSSAASGSAKASVETPFAFPLRFRGTAIIGGTNELRIEALRVTE